MKRFHGWRVLALVAGTLCGPMGALAMSDAAEPRHAAYTASEFKAARDLAQRVLAAADHGGRPFAIVDKRSASILVFRGDGSLAGSSSVLLGEANGDESVLGVGERTESGRLRPDDRITPAGRFNTEPGHNRHGEPVVWIDYDAALAIHRLRPSPARENRAQRLASSNPLDKRISAGCVVVSVAFFEAVIQPVLGRGRGVVYVIPEDPQRPAQHV